MMSLHAALMLALGIFGAVTCASARGHEMAAAFARYAGQQQLYPETVPGFKNARSPQVSGFEVEDVPETSKSSSPVIIKLYAPVAKPEALHANLPLRFGRSSARDAVWTFPSPLKLTRRVGRSQEADSSIALPCHQCARAGGVAAPSATLPQRFGRTNRRYPDAGQPHRRSRGRGLRFDYVDVVREEDTLNFPKDAEYSRGPASG